MATRTRSQVGSGQFHTGRKLQKTLGSTNVDETRSSNRGSDSCTDVIGNYGGVNPLTLTAISNDSGFIRGRSSTSTSTFTEYSGEYPLRLFEQSSGMLQYMSLPTWSYGFDPVTRLLALTSPSRPAVDLPVFIAELRDLPRLVLLAGKAQLRRAAQADRSRLQDLAAANLAVQFGWIPLISDLTKLLDFASHAQAKADEINRLVSKGGLRRNITLARRSGNLSDINVLGNSNVDVYVWLNRAYEGKLWGSVRWLPTAPPGSDVYTDKNRIFRAALGLGLEISTIWEILPWSWLIDYFTSIGDFLSAHRNFVPAKPTRICIMRTDVEIATQKGPYTKPSWISVTPGSVRRTKKTRTVNGAPTLTAFMPYLGAGRLSILASLAVLRGKYTGRGI